MLIKRIYEPFEFFSVCIGAHVGNVLKFHEKHCEPTEMKVKEGRSEISPSKTCSLELTLVQTETDVCFPTLPNSR